jgi:replicative DNA helicase
MDEPVLPGVTDVELVFIGACLEHSDVLADSTIAADDFENPLYGAIFERMRERQRNNEGVSQLLLAAEFPEYTRQIWSATDLMSETRLGPFHEKTIRDRSTRRKLKAAAMRINAIADGTDMDGIVERARAEVDSAIRNDEVVAVSMLTDVREVLAEHRKEVALVPTPWHSMNEIIGGFGPGRMYVLGARPGVGKSALAAQMAYTLAREGPVIFATMEMSKAEVYTRVISQQAQIYYGGMDKVQPAWMAEREEEWLANANRDIRVLDQGTQTVDSIRAAVRAASRDGQVAGVVVDYLHLLTAKGEQNEVARIAGITRALKQMAMDYKVPVIALSQLNRQVTKAENARPGLADLRGSGAIEQDADSVIFLYKDDNDAEEVLNVYVAKNRQGQAFVGFTLNWQGAFVRAMEPLQ